MERLSAKGRTYIKGRALSDDFRKSIVDELVRNGGDVNTGYFPGRFSDVANNMKVARSCVEKVWMRLHASMRSTGLLVVVVLLFNLSV